MSYICPNRTVVFSFALDGKTVQNVLPTAGQQALLAPRFPNHAHPRKYYTIMCAVCMPVHNLFQVQTAPSVLRSAALELCTVQVVCAGHSKAKHRLAFAFALPSLENQYYATVSNFSH